MKLLKKSLLTGYGISAVTFLIWANSPGDNVPGSVADWILFPGFAAAVSLGVDQIHDLWVWVLAFILNGLIYGGLIVLATQALRVVRRRGNS